MAEAIDIVKTLEKSNETLKGFKAQVEETKNNRIRNEARLENLVKNESEIVERIKSLGYDPDKLKNLMEEKSNKLSAILTKISSVMPDENGNIPLNAYSILNIKQDVQEITTPLEQEKPKGISGPVNFDDIPI